MAEQYQSEQHVISEKVSMLSIGVFQGLLEYEMLPISKLNIGIKPLIHVSMLMRYLKLTFLSPFAAIKVRQYLDGRSGSFGSFPAVMREN